MADQTKLPTLAELRRALRAKERELSELDLMLADYHAEHSRLILELRQLQTQLRAAQEAAASSLSESRRPHGEAGGAAPSSEAGRF